MNIKEIKQLLNLITEHGLAEFELEREGTRIMIKKYPSSPGLAPITYAAAPMEIASPLSKPATPAESAKETKETEVGIHLITSPIVGTFYSAPSPDSSPFVNKGSKIGPNDTVCIVEAMKVMNEIKAEVSGTVEEICVENGQAVEFGQVLFKVRI